MAGKSAADMQHVKDRLTTVFKVRFLGEANCFLGMSLYRSLNLNMLHAEHESKSQAGSLPFDFVHTDCNPSLNAALQYT